MLVRLTRVCPHGVGYLLKEVFVNPEHVVMLDEDIRYRKLNEDRRLAEGLSLNHRFTRLLLNQQNSESEIVVIGDPRMVDSKLKSSKKTLLKG
jgi:hypothetical protein